jgi:ABC-2 type transport system permease protein
MNAFLAILKKDLLQLLKDKKAVVLLALTPFIFIVLFSGVARVLTEDSEYIKPFEIALADGENSIRTSILIEQLKGTGIFSNIRFTTGEEARDMVHGGQVPAAIIIPPGFTSSVAVGENKPVEVVGNALYPYQARIVYNIIESAAAMVSAGQAAVNTIYHYDVLAGLEGGDINERFNEAVGEVLDMAISRRRIFSRIPGPAGYDVTPYEYLTAAALSMFLMFSGLPAARMFITEKNTGVYTRIVSSAAKPFHVMASKIVVTLLIGIIQFGTVFVLTLTVLGNYWKGNIPAVIGITLSALLSAVCWSALVVSVSATPASAEMIGSLGTILLTIAGGGIYPLHRLPDAIRGLSSFTVGRWVMEGYMAVFSGFKGISALRYSGAILGAGLLLLVASLLIEAIKSCFKRLKRHGQAQLPRG